MRYPIIVLTAIFALFCYVLASAGASQPSPVAIAIHAGAGTLKREELTQERDRQIRATLEQSIRAGHEVLVAASHPFPIWRSMTRSSVLKPGR